MIVKISKKYSIKRESTILNKFDEQSTLTTERLQLRLVAVDDWQFMLKLLNDECFIRFIGDRKIRTKDQAVEYLQGVMEKSKSSGDRLFVVSLSAVDCPIGVCSLLKRVGLDAPDIGFAFLPEYRRKGYAFEAASATLGFAQTKLGMERIIAITSPENADSISLLEKLGLRFDSQIQFGDEFEESLLFVLPTR